MAARLILSLLLMLAPGLLWASQPPPVLAADLLIRQDRPAIDWRWRAAPEAGLEPALLRSLRGEALADAARAHAAAQGDEAQARAAGYPFRKHQYLIDWSVAADTGRLLVLLGTGWQYTGGAHGNTGYGTRLWDRQTSRTIAIDALFTNWPAVLRLIEPGYCAALDTERRRRGPDYLSSDFEACPPLAEQIILPAAAPLEAAARSVRIILPPYAAGPFSEGSYVLTLPWPKEASALVAAPWRSVLGMD